MENLILRMKNTLSSNLRVGCFRRISPPSNNYGRNIFKSLAKVSKVENLIFEPNGYRLESGSDYLLIDAIRANERLIGVTYQDLGN